ncbi:hypothetical protein AAVH_10715, partial [Aphelenchoides avenae]
AVLLAANLCVILLTVNGRNRMQPAVCELDDEPLDDSTSVESGHNRTQRDRRHGSLRNVDADAHYLRKYGAPIYTLSALLYHIRDRFTAIRRPFKKPQHRPLEFMDDVRWGILCRRLSRSGDAGFCYSDVCGVAT